MTGTIVKVVGSKKVRKIKLSSWMLKLAGFFIDYEAEHLPPDSRIVEYPFVLAKLTNMPTKGKMLDVGCIALHNYASPMMCFAGWDVYGIDIRSKWHFQHPNFHFIQGDIRTNQFGNGMFDVVVCISTIEHIGLSGYYGNTIENRDGDITAIQEMARIIKHGGKLLLTVPYCSIPNDKAGCRIYNTEKLEKLLTNFVIKSEVVYQQDKDKYWQLANRNIKQEGVICLEVIRK